MKNDHLLRVTLVYLPATDPSIPASTLALLKAILDREKSFHVNIRDINVETFDSLLRSESLEYMTERIRSKLSGFPDQEKISNEYREKLSSIVSSSPEVISNINEAVKILRTPEKFYSPDSLLFAKIIFQRACELISISYDNNFGKYSYSSMSFDSFEEISIAIMKEKDGLLAESFNKKVIPSVLKDSPDIIGISVQYFSQLIPSLLFSMLLKKVAPDVCIAMGGPIVTWGSHILGREPRFGKWIDAVAIGEADDSFVTFLNYISGKSKKNEVTNFIFYNNDGSIDITKDCNRYVDLNSLPTPDFSSLPMESYFAPDRIICITPTRGCYYNCCSFCNYAFIKHAPYRERDPYLVAEDAKAIRQMTGESVFSFETDVMSPIYLENLSVALQEVQADIKWHAVARFDKGLTDNVVRTMKNSGCVRIYMGMESASHRILALLKKGINPKRIHDILTYFQEAGISTEVGIIAGFPSETSHDRNETYQFLLKHRKAMTRCDIGKFRLLRGSPIAMDPKRYGIKFTGNPENYWHHLPYEIAVDHEAQDADNFMRRVQSLYPEAAIIDVSEDILYCAKLGHDILRNFFKSPNISVDGIENKSCLALSLSDNVSVKKYIITNAGNVSVVDLSEFSPTQPLFSSSEIFVILAVNLKKGWVIPLNELEIKAIEKIETRPDCMHLIETLKNDNEYTSEEAEWTIARLISQGILETTAYN